MPVFPRKRLTRREKWVVASGVALVCLLLGVRPAVNRWFLFRAALRNPAPSQQAMTTWWEAQRDRAAALEALWRTQFIPQRLFAIDQFRDLWKGGQGERYPELIPFLARAVLDGNFDVRCVAIELVAAGSRTNAPLLIPALADTDSEVRFVAVRALKRCGTALFTRCLTPLLDDPSANVRVAAACGLRNWSARDEESHGMLGVLAEVIDRFGPEVQVVLVSVDEVRSEHVGGAHCHEHHGEEDCEHGDHGKGHSADLAALIRSLCEEHGLHVPVCVDTGAVTFSFVADELPTTVLVDGAGLVCRRFVGPRSSKELIDMVLESARRSSVPGRRNLGGSSKAGSMTTIRFLSNVSSLKGARDVPCRIGRSGEQTTSRVGT